MTDTAALLHTLLSQRLLVLDGAMGTMIQRLKLTDEQFRGERFRKHPRDLKGNSDLLVLTRPDLISASHGAYLAAGSSLLDGGTSWASQAAAAPLKVGTRAAA